MIFIDASHIRYCSPSSNNEHENILSFPFPSILWRTGEAVYGILWFIWVARNNRIFKQIRMRPTKVVDEVILDVYLVQILEVKV